MATEKKRVNVSLSKPVAKAIAYLAKRDDVPYATKAAHLIQEALDLDEDLAWERLARQRLNCPISPLSHEEVWRTYGL